MTITLDKLKKKVLVLCFLEWCCGLLCFGLLLNSMLVCVCVSCSLSASYTYFACNFVRLLCTVMSFVILFTSWGKEWLSLINFLWHSSKKFKGLFDLRRWIWDAVELKCFLRWKLWEGCLFGGECICNLKKKTES